MTLASVLIAVRRWRERSLANVLSLNAAAIAIVSSLVVAFILLGVMYWSENTSLQQQLQTKAVRLAERLESTIDVVENASLDLSRSPMLMTALLDSFGRATNVVPYLDNYRFPIATPSALALCDINGVLLAGMKSELAQCRANSPLFQQVIADGITRRELLSLGNGHLAWVSFKGVVFSYTGSVEGVIVTQLDLQEVMKTASRDLDLHAIRLVRSDSLTPPLISLMLEDDQKSSLNSARAAVFKSRMDSLPYPMDVEVRDHLLPFAGNALSLALAYVAGIVLLVLGVLAWARRVSQRSVEPLTRLTRVAQEIAVTGNLGLQVPVQAQAEVGQLAIALYAMVTALRISEATLEAKVIHRTEALQRSEAAAEAANLAKSRFLATMSHEIRTPMNGILGMAQMLLAPELPDDERQDCARIILESGQGLMALLNDILDLSKIEAGKIELLRTWVLPEQIMRDTVRLFSGSAHLKNLPLHCHWTGPPGLLVEGDAPRLMQMLGNLVGNAIKFTAHGHVRLDGCEIDRTPEQVLLEFSVTDTGIGIAPDQRHLLFKPFSQADSTRTREFGGTGLGLSIVQSLAALMDGQVGFDSIVGQGSRFWFRIRAGLASHSAQPALRQPQNDSPSLQSDLLQEQPDPAVVTVPIDSEQFDALVKDIMPLLAQHKFDAIDRFRQLKFLAAGTTLAADIHAIAELLARLQFDQALERLQQIDASRRHVATLSAKDPS